MNTKITDFVVAHKCYFNNALAEIKSGQKQSHWM